MGESNEEFDAKTRKMFAKLPWVVGQVKEGNQMNEGAVTSVSNMDNLTKTDIKFGLGKGSEEDKNDIELLQENVESEIFGDDEDVEKLSDIDDDDVAREETGQSNKRVKLVTSFDVKTPVDSMDPSWLREKKGKDFLLDELTEALKKIDNADNVSTKYDPEFLYSCKFCQVPTEKYPKKKAGDHLFTCHQDWYEITKLEVIKRNKGRGAFLRNQMEYEKLFLSCINRIGNKRTEKVFLSKKGKQMLKFGENNHLEVAGDRVAQIIGKQKSFKGYNNYFCRECGINLPEGQKGQMRYEVAKHIKNFHSAIYTEIGLKISRDPGQELDSLITESVKCVRNDESNAGSAGNQSIENQGNLNTNRDMMKQAKIDVQNKLGNLFCRINNFYQCKKCVGLQIGKDKKFAVNHLQSQHSLEFKQLQAEVKNKYDDFINRQLQSIIRLVFHKV